MQRLTLTALAVALLSAATAHDAQAQSQLGPVPDNATVVFGGLRWAWASPLPAGDAGWAPTNQFSLYGWRLPTALELQNAPDATDFLFDGGNVPFASIDPASSARFQATNSAYTSAASAGACATPWFSTEFVHCDWQDGNGQTFGPWAGSPGARSFADQLVVQGLASVPEPGSLALLLSGLTGLAIVARRRRA